MPISFPAPYFIVLLYACVFKFLTDQFLYYTSAKNRLTARVLTVGFPPLHLADFLLSSSLNTTFLAAGPHCYLWRLSSASYQCWPLKGNVVQLLHRVAGTTSLGGKSRCHFYTIETGLQSVCGDSLRPASDIHHGNILVFSSTLTGLHKQGRQWFQHCRSALWRLYRTSE